MDSNPSNDVTILLNEWQGGDSAALDRLLPVVYRELQRLAASYLRAERPGHTLQPTALIHEAYLRLVSQKTPDFRNRSHFFGVAAQVMRQVLVDYARSRSTLKRAGGKVREASCTTILEMKDDGRPEIVDVIQLDDALAALAAENETLARLVEMRYFGGLTAEESAEALGLSVHIVRHNLRYAQAWLRRKLAA